MLFPGDSIGPYTIRERAGQGGMAIVFKAWHNGLHRFEALKVPRGAGQSAPDSAYIQRLLAEARVAAGLRHPHIVGIHGVSEPLAPIPYFAMDWVQGSDLAQILAEKGAFSLQETIQILEKVALALDYAHSRGVVHRDIKPANILLSEEGDFLVPKVVDFGISRAAEDEEGAGETKLTRSGMIVGTPEYMSPEQAGSGDKVDFRTDIYSLGIVAYEMLCGTPPFTAGAGVSRLSILISQVRDHAPLWEKFPGFPPLAGAAILRSLAKSPDERPASCAAFIAELRAAQQVGEASWQPQIALQTASKNSISTSRHSASAASLKALTNADSLAVERTPFDGAEFERDESATLFERPISLSDTPPPGPAPTLLPQLQGAETALETPLETPTSAGFSLRARLEAAKTEAARNDNQTKPLPAISAALPVPEASFPVVSTPNSAGDSIPNLEKSGPTDFEIALKPVPGKLAPSFSPPEIDVLPIAPLAGAMPPRVNSRSNPRIGVFAGFGGVIVGAALVMMLMGRGATTPRVADAATPPRTVESEVSPAEIAVDDTAPDSEITAQAAIPAGKTSPTPTTPALSVVASNGAAQKTAASALSAPRLRTVKLVRNSAIPFETSTQNSSRRAAGTRAVTQSGREGTLQTTLEISYQGDKEMARRTLSKVVTQKPTPQIVTVGTRVIEAPPRPEPRRVPPRRVVPVAQQPARPPVRRVVRAAAKVAAQPRVVKPRVVKTRARKSSRITEAPLPE